MKTLLYGLSIALTISGCAKGDGGADSTGAPAGATSDTVAAAAATAKAIEANPAGADSILKAAGYTRESFQQLMYDIAADSAKAARYAAAKGP